MNRLSFASAAAVWALLVLGSLQVTHAPIPESLFCGVWGCTAPLPALAAYNLCWLSLLSGPALLFGMHSSPRSCRPLAWALVSCALLGTFALALYEHFSWYVDAPASVRPYYWPHLGVAVLNWVDPPLLPILLVGVGLAVVGGRVESPPAESSAAPGIVVE